LGFARAVDRTIGARVRVRDSSIGVEDGLPPVVRFAESEGPMAAEKQRLSPAERANLVAYLDGELNEAEARAISTKLTPSVSARRELEALEKTWVLLDYLPRPAASPELTSRTLSEVRRLAGRDGEFLAVAEGAALRAARVGALALSTILTLGVGYAATRWVWPDPTARLVRELSLAEHLDEYLDAGDFAFLAHL